MVVATGVTSGGPWAVIGERKSIGACCGTKGCLGSEGTSRASGSFWSSIARCRG
jgi:hypothetical protein